MRRGVERAAARARFDHDGRRAQGRDDAVSLQKPPTRRGRARGQLAEHHAVGLDPIEQLSVPRRIRAVGAAGQYRDRWTAGRKGGPVRHTVDTVRGARDNHETAPGQLCAQLHRDVFAVARRRTRADDRDKRALLRLMQIPAGSR